MMTSEENYDDITANLITEQHANLITEQHWAWIVFG